MKISGGSREGRGQYRIKTIMYGDDTDITYITDHTLTTYQLHTDNIPTTHRPNINHIPTTYPSHTDRLLIPTTYQKGHYSFTINRTLPSQNNASMSFVVESREVSVHSTTSMSSGRPANSCPTSAFLLLFGLYSHLEVSWARFRGTATQAPNVPESRDTLKSKGWGIRTYT